MNRPVNIPPIRKRSKSGRPRKYDYKGAKKITSIRLTYAEKKSIQAKFESIQAFVELAMKQLL